MRARPPTSGKLSKAAAPDWHLVLYVDGPSSKSAVAYRNLEKICKEHLAGRYRIEVIDLKKHPEIARDNQIVAVPMVMRKSPPLDRRIIGDMSNTERVLAGLELKPSVIPNPLQLVDAGQPWVLVVEDNKAVADFIAGVLSVQFRVTIVSDGLSGLEKTVELRPDVIVTDIAMPQMSGDQMIAEIRKQTDFDDTPIIVLLSAKADEAVRVRLLRDGVQDFIVKPFAREELLARVGNMATTKRAKDVLQSELSAKSGNLETMARELVLRKRELEIMNRLKDEFIATISHELRTPLTSIHGWIRLMRTTDLDDATRSHALETIERNVRAQMALIDDMLDLSSITTGKIKIEIEQVDLRPIVEGVVSSARLAASSKQITVLTELESAVQAVQGDPNRLRQIVSNLVNNAIKFSKSGGEVKVRLRQEGPRVEIVVTDHGKGIDAEFLSYVFEPFCQEDTSTTRQHYGLGLGLAIVRSLVELQGGTVRAQSEGRDRGATFTVGFPAMPAAPDVRKNVLVTAVR